MKLSASLPMVDSVNRRRAGDEQKTERLRQERQSSANSAARDADARSVKQAQIQKPLQDTTHARPPKDERAGQQNFYRFKEANEYPSHTQRALGAYQSNQSAANHGAAPSNSVEVKSNIDTFA